MSVIDILQQNLESIEREIGEACARANRDRREVRLIAVTKYAQWEWVCELLKLGVCDLGESRPQQLIGRFEQLKTSDDAGRFAEQRNAGPFPQQQTESAEHVQLPNRVHWHLIGQLQRNKVRAVLPYADWIHSVDSDRLLDRINRISGELGLTARILLQVNISGELSKQGFTADDVLARLPEWLRFQHLQIAGLMTMAPRGSDEVTQSVFRGLRELRDRLRDSLPARTSAPTRGETDEPLAELSMGMSGDFAAAIREGATQVRIGSRLFAGLETA